MNKNIQWIGKFFFIIFSFILYKHTISTLFHEFIEAWQFITEQMNRKQNV